MTRHFLFALLPAMMLWSCSKNTDDTGGNGRGTFVINGIHDAAAGSTLYLAVAKDTGDAPKVTLKVTGAPPNITPVITPDNGVADFNTAIFFRQTEAVAEGIYPLVITGTSAACTRTYSCNLHVYNFDGWFLDDNTFYQDSSTRHTGDLIESYSRDNGKATFMASIHGTWPARDGSYTYNIGDGSGDVQLQFINEKTSAYYRSATTAYKATLSIVNGKFTFSAFSIPIASGSDARTLSVMVQE